MFQKPPLISVVTICYNEPHLEKTCESIVSQTYQNFEWIVIDGGSKQETLDVFENYKTYMTYFVSEKDRGIYHAMNKGLLQARGEYVIFMNAGDYFYSSDILEKVVDSGLDQDIVYGDLKMTMGGGRKVGGSLSLGCGLLFFI